MKGIRGSNASQVAQFLKSKQLKETTTRNGSSLNDSTSFSTAGQTKVKQTRTKKSQSVTAAEALETTH